MISAGLPPIPTKLLNRIQDGLFVEMSDLLPDTLTSAEYNPGELKIMLTAENQSTTES